MGNSIRFSPTANAFHRPRSGPPPSKREGWGLRRSRPTALPSIAYRGFAVAPMTLRAPSRNLVYNSGCRVATLLVSMGVMGFLGDLRGRNSKSPPNPLGLAERVYSFHRLRAVPLPRGGRSLGKGSGSWQNIGGRAMRAPTTLREIATVRCVCNAGLHHCNG